MKKIVKFSRILLIALALVALTTSVFAASSPSSFKGNITDTDKFNSVGGKIVGGIQSVGTIASIGILVVLGLKYMMGSTEEKAEYKKTMIPYVIGAVVVFAASTIAGMVYNFASEI